MTTPASRASVRHRGRVGDRTLYGRPAHAMRSAALGSAGPSGRVRPFVFRLRRSEPLRSELRRVLLRWVMGPRVCFTWRDGDATDVSIVDDH
jgi:hypothetical protein